MYPNWIYNHFESYPKWILTSPQPFTLSIYGEGFLKKGERHEQTQRLSGHVRDDTEEYGGQVRNFFAVIQQQRNGQDLIY